MVSLPLSKVTNSAESAMLYKFSVKDTKFLSPLMTTFFKAFYTQMFVITTICDGDTLQEYCKSVDFDTSDRPRAYRCLRVNPTYLNFEMGS